MKAKYWTSGVKSVDDFGRRITDHFYDSRTKFGPWAIMNEETFRQLGVGVGTGRGQQYAKQSDGRWLKVEG